MRMISVVTALLVVLFGFSGARAALSLPAVHDAAGKALAVPVPVQRVICSGSGCLRLLTYLQAQHMAVAVDDIEVRRDRFDARPYALANPSFKNLPVFGQFRGYDNPERILMLAPQPQVVFKTYTSSMGYDPLELQQKTGIPVVVLNYGDLGAGRQHLYDSLRMMGHVVGKTGRAEEVITFFENAIADLQRRTAGIAENMRPSVFVGGIAFKGPHGFQSTEPAYPPFSFVNARNLAGQDAVGSRLQHSDVAREKIVQWNPDYLFVDLSTLRLADKANGIEELRSDPAYAMLSAVRQGRVFGLLPYNWYTQNYGSILANAYYIGSVLYPERFADVDPAAKADEIYTFLVGSPVFDQLNRSFDGLAYRAVPVN